MTIIGHGLHWIVLLLMVGCQQRPTGEPAPTAGIPQLPSASAASLRTLLFVKIPDPIAPVERSRRYEDPLDALIKARGLGEVSGGGSMLSKDGEILWVGVDVDVDDPKRALPVLKAKLRELGVPRGTVIEESTSGKPIVHAVW